MKEKKIELSRDQQKHLSNVNETRRIMNMTELKPVMRECLRCSTKFTSFQYSNRLCTNCRGYSEGI